MRFIDEATIRIAAGHGGPGCISFRRETFAPRGGPDGGDGGAGGDVVFIADSQLSTLQDFRYKRAYQAPAGMHGSGTNKAGRDGENLEIRIPVGTVIRDSETGEVLVDFTEHGQEWIGCEGGRGGKGNAHFVTSTFQAPKFAQPGEEGTAREIRMELKLLADVAIIGFPNAGKSTLISTISAARPKIADYEFTTLTPNLGVVAFDEHRNFVVADIPGLIEGAHQGLGLGHKFLKHIERTRMFVHLLDGTKLLEDATKPESKLPDLTGEESGASAEVANDEAFDDMPAPGEVSWEEGQKSTFDRAIDQLIHRYMVIRKELGLFNESLLHKPEIVALNKIDLFESDPLLVERARKALRERIASIRGTHPLANEPLIISTVARKGIDELLGTIRRELDDHRSKEPGGNRTVIQMPDAQGIRR